MNTRRGHTPPAKPLAATLALVAVALVSALVLSPRFSSVDTYESLFQTLDEKKATVLKLTAASAMASAALSAFPDDACTPIAERLSEISKDFTFVIAALLLEKYLLTTLGFAFFSLLVPLCCVLFAIAALMRPHGPNRRVVLLVALKLLAFGLAMVVATPLSVFVTSRIDATYAESIEATINGAQQATQIIETATADTRKDPQNPLEFVQQRVEDLTNAANAAALTISNAWDWIQGLLNSFIEAFAVMMVTSVVIPILVPIALYLLFKMLFGQQSVQVVSVGEPRALPSHARRQD